MAMWETRAQATTTAQNGKRLDSKRTVWKVIMSQEERSMDTDSSDQSIKPSEAEILELLEKAAHQYEEYIRLTEIPDFPDSPDVKQPKYSWDNPIGLVIKE